MSHGENIRRTTDSRTPFWTRVLSGAGVGTLVGFMNRNDPDVPGIVVFTMMGAGIGLIIGIVYAVKKAAGRDDNNQELP